MPDAHRSGSGSGSGVRVAISQRQDEADNDDADYKNDDDYDDDDYDDEHDDEDAEAGKYGLCCLMSFALSRFSHPWRTLGISDRAQMTPRTGP